MSNADVLRKQLAMLPGTWEAFRSNGVSPGTRLQLDFAFRAPTLEAAQRMAQAIPDCECKVRPTPTNPQGWSVEGRTPPMPVSPEHLRGWVTLMVELGTSQGSVFDGFGAQMP